VLQATPSQQSKKVLNQFFWNEGNYPLSVDTLTLPPALDKVSLLLYNGFKRIRKHNGGGPPELHITFDPRSLKLMP